MTRPYGSISGVLAIAMLAVAADHNPTAAQKKAAPVGPANRTLAPAPKKTASVPTEDAHRLALEVTALQTLYQLQLTPAQMQSLAKISKDTATTIKGTPSAKVSTKFRKTLTDLRSALIADQEDRVAELSEKLDRLFDEEDVALEDRVPINDTARRKAPDFVRILQPSQVAFLVSDLESETLDPFDRIVDTVENGRKLAPAAWGKLRDSVAEELAWLAAGSNPNEARLAARRVANLLDRQRSLSPTAFEANQESLEKEANGILANVGPFEVVRHAVERELAELLANPQLPVAIQARMQAAKK